jgi:hypothetical protein
MIIALWFTGVFFFVAVGVTARAVNDSKTERGAKVAVGFGVFFALLAFWPVVLAYNIGHEPKATYTAKVENFAVLPGPTNDVRVWLSVTNTGKGPGQPMCMVSIQPVDQYGDPVGTGGFDSLAGNHTVQPGATFAGYMDIVVSGNDAHWVKSKSDITISQC